MSEEIVLSNQSGFLAPVVSVKDALMAYQAKKELIDHIFQGPTKENPGGVDYGVVPGSSKPTLLKAGAEKATSFFGLFPRFADAEVVNDWTGEQHGGEPFFYYRRTCNLYRGDVLIVSVDGSCNSFEKKYRYRGGERICPSCGKPAIRKSKFPPRNKELGKEPGWYCFDKQGGCGAEFSANDPKITEQQLGQVKNPDVADLVNTILKMADKRALVAATLIATGLSEYFTQDIEDYVTGEFSEVSAQPKTQSTSTIKMTASQPSEPPEDDGYEPPFLKESENKKNDSRPYAPADFKAAFEKLVGVVSDSYAKNNLTLEASDNERKILASIIDTVFGDKGVSRHPFCTWLCGAGSTKDMTPAQVKALFRVMEIRNDSEHPASYNDAPSSVSIQEFKAAYAVAIRN